LGYIATGISLDHFFLYFEINDEKILLNPFLSFNISFSSLPLLRDTGLKKYVVSKDHGKGYWYPHWPEGACHTPILAIISRIIFVK